MCTAASRARIVRHPRKAPFRARREAAITHKLAKGRGMHAKEPPPILAHKWHSLPSAFTPENLLREARRQKGKAEARVPDVCVLDPDGDLLRHLKTKGAARRDQRWACYHTALYGVRHAGLAFGLVGHAVGAPFAVLVAEQLFACGCRLLISMTSAGQLKQLRSPPYFVLIDRALRDEGTSYHYLPAAEFSDADPHLLQTAEGALKHLAVPIARGASWTTDAPFRETPEAIRAMEVKGLLAVEMEAAALYAFGAARAKPVVCFAHVTNRMATVEGDFEKGEADGSVDALAVIAATAQACRAMLR
jgi:uridine phosphorylase